MSTKKNTVTKNIKTKKYWKGIKRYSDVLFWSIKITEIALKSKNFNKARDQVFSKWQIKPEVKREVTALTYTLSKKLGLTKLLIEASQREKFEESSSLLRATLLVTGTEILTNAVNVNTILEKLIKVYPRLKVHAGFSKRLEWVLKKLRSTQAKILKNKITSLWKIVKYFSTPALAASEEDFKLLLNYSFPAWFFKKLKKQYGRNTALKIVDFFNNKGISPVRINAISLALESNTAILSNFKEEKSYEISKSQAFKKGLITVQSKMALSIAAKSAELIIELLNQKDKVVVFDACSAPGKKLGAIIEYLVGQALLNNKKESANNIFNTSSTTKEVIVISNDIQFPRIKQTIEEIKRILQPLNPKHTSLVQIEAGFIKIEISNILKLKIAFLCSDALKLPIKPTNLSITIPFDISILDVPCTGSGTVQKHPERRWFINPQDPIEFSYKQVEFIKKFVKLTTSYIIYATCSIFKEENQMVIKTILKSHTLQTSPKTKSQPEIFQAGIPLIQLKFEKVFLPHIENSTGGYCTVLSVNHAN